MVAVKVVIEVAEYIEYYTILNINLCYKVEHLFSICAVRRRKPILRRRFAVAQSGQVVTSFPTKTTTNNL